MSEPKDSALVKLRVGFSPKRDDHLDALSSGLLQKSPWFEGTLGTADTRRVDLPDLEDYAVFSQRHVDALNKAKQESLHLSAFKERYIKIRTDNIALTHEHAIELVKMIQREADQITYKDTQ